MSSWRTLLLRIGDSCPEYGGTTDLAEHIETCYNTISRELEYSRDDILQFILQCAEQVPHKIPIYGTLVGLLNLETEDFAKTIVENTQTNLQDALDSGNCNRIRILMRFVTALMCSKVVQPGSVIELFETLLSSAATTVDEESGNPSWQPRADFYVTCILSCLPWCGLELNEQVPEEIERVLVGVEAYLSIRKHDNDGDSSIFEFAGENGGLPKKDHLEDLWHRIQDLSNNGWKVDSVPRPHLFFEAQLVSGKSHEFSSIACPDQPELSAVSSDISRSKQRHEAELKYPRRIYRLNIFPTSKFENMQPIDRFVVEEYLLDVLLFFNGCRKECAAYMVGLPVPFRYEYLMAETIFSQLLTLPQPPFRPIYYTLVIIDLCKALPGAFPAVVAGAVRALYKRIGDLDMECRSRLILWFSHHLANFQFIWPWNEWSYVLDLPKWAPQRVFVQEVLEREVRLSYWDKVKQSIENASALEELLPPKGGPSFKFGTEDAKEGIERTLSLELRNMVKEKKTAREIISWIEDSVVPLHGSKITLETVVQTLLDIGSKSFTHLITVLERYGQVISKLCPEHDKQLMLMDEISSFWKNSTQMTAIAIDRMMGYRLISNLAIVSWVFSSSNSREFHTSDRPWEILKNAVNKTYNRICDLRKEISLLKESIKLAEASVTEAKSELDSAESKLEIVNGQPVPAETPGRLKRLKGYFDKRKEELVSIQENLEAKEVLLARASEENKNLFVSLYKSFWNILSDCLYQLSSDGRDFVSKPSFVDAMSVDNEEASEHDELAEENGLPQNSQMNGENKGNDYNVGEQEQWCLTTLGYLKAFSTQYASEIWLYMEQLDAEIFTKKVHPLFRKAVYTGLRLHIDSELQ